ncbi:MAG: DUF2292 domain-containing protein [Betaproteobacteria bacterium HGW-Betaproteobacteria-1]|jgi:hypothetical protein|nr:MAG: DUF2292 domain-containing protein [Betaproteobacteria bacterium HGW-Betaproteobacteria-1]
MSVHQSNRISDEVIREVLQAIEQLRFGSVEITVHDNRVTQIERREKVRFGQAAEQATQKLKPGALNIPTAKAAANH